MKTQQFLWQNGQWLSQSSIAPTNFSPQIVFLFGDRLMLQTDESYHNALRIHFPVAQFVIASTCGDVIDEHLHDNTLTAHAVEFEKSQLDIRSFDANEKSIVDLGIEIGNSYKDIEDIQLLMLISDGSLINGSNLVQGLNKAIEGKFPIIGGLAGDSTRFEKTCLGLDYPPTENIVVAIGFCGKSLKVGYSSKGGWDVFGPVRTVTKSAENILYELDGENALDLYKRYLGERAEELPGAALLFPLCLHEDENGQRVVRSILSINKSNALVFAGNMPQGSKVQLMKANFDCLIDGSIDAAADATKQLPSPELAILISSFGRKIVLGQKVEEEIEEAKRTFGAYTTLMGFYAYGEIAPSANKYCALHNQTMTITTISE